MEIFLSYAREDRESARILADDLSTLGHQVWLDQKLRGGQDWWDEILARLRSCDLYVFVLSPAALKSQACEAELHYANALRRPLLPVKVRETSANVLPRLLAQAQHVDYTSADKQAAFGLASSLAAVPTETPLPESLPSKPELPMAPLHEAKALVDSTRDLSRAQQLDLLDRLRHASQIDDQRDDARELLSQFRSRTDIFGDVRDQVDVVLAQVGKPSSGVHSAENGGQESAPGATTFKVRCWSLSASNPGESGWKAQWSYFRDNWKGKKGTLVVESGRLRFGEGEDQLEITGVTGVSLEALTFNVESVVVHYGDGQHVAIDTNQKGKLIKAIQGAFGLS